MNLIETLNWRYATKKFDNTKEVSTSDLEDIIEAFRLSASGFGLQPWHLVIVEDKNKKQELLEHSYNQPQVVDSSKLLVLCYKVPDDNMIDEFLDDMASKTGASRENLKGYEDMMKGFMGYKDLDAKKVWAQKQVYIALGNLLNSLAFKKIDSCALEGFVPEKYDEILGLSEKGLYSAVVLPIGYRSLEDKYASYPKIRYEKEKISTII